MWVLFWMKSDDNYSGDIHLSQVAGMFKAGLASSASLFLGTTNVSIFKHDECSSAEALPWRIVPKKISDPLSLRTLDLEI